MNNCGDPRRESAEGSGSKLRSNDVSRDRRGHEYQPAPEKELAPNEAKGHAKDGSTRKGINAGNHDGEVRVDAGSCSWEVRDRALCQKRFDAAEVAEKPAQAPGSGEPGESAERKEQSQARTPRCHCGLTVKLSGRTMPPGQRRGRTVSFSVCGAQPPTPHDPLQRGLGGPPNEPDGLRTFAQENVSRAFARDVLGAFIAQSTHIDVVQEMLSGTKQDRSDSEMQLVNQPGA
jgi:hypothetical protein